MSMPEKPLLCVITDESSDPVTQAQQALRGGASMIQLRHKHACGHDLYTWSCRIHNLCKKTNAVFIINDRVDIAMACRADGVHLGQEDLPAHHARKLMGPDALIGVSASSKSEALQAVRDGANYIGFGHVFPTASKTKPYPPRGLQALQETAAAVMVPVIAIGGITTENAMETIRHGASGIAVISAVTQASEPTAATTRLLIAIGKHLHQ